MPDMRDGGARDADGAGSEDGMTELEQFDESRAKTRETFIRKNRTYGAAYNRRGVLGVLIRMEDKIARAFQLLDGAEGGDEDLEDTLEDLSNYATIAAMLAARGNLRGEQ